MPSYHQYGISPQLVERVKLKMKNPAIKDRIKQMVDGLTRADLQDRPKVRRLVRTATSVLGERLSGTQEEQIVQFVIDQKIDPRNTLHLLRLWGMFR
ncbi:serine/threonine protein kinase [Paenibacillus oralis]|uniref:Serine/threonine protein kinase n=1 Tax=Paenibacillus oralis TaxID=2490856 RepID=A0A3P3U844_9BACL|nr:stage VI sporulation protein F [Paenibacillus oralis]RRJ66527.1 serine/threonine protein kinase [Paenibacillus oralis]